MTSLCRCQWYSVNCLYFAFHHVLTGSFPVRPARLWQRTVLSSSSNGIGISFSWGFVSLLSHTFGCFEVSYIHIDDPFCLLRLVTLSLMSLIPTMLISFMLLWILIIVLYLKICSLKIKTTFLLITIRLTSLFLSL